MRDIASIRELKVVAAQEGRVVGSVSQVVVDLSSGELVGLIVGEGASEQGIAAEDISVIGSDAVMVETSKVAQPLSELPELIQKRQDLQETPKEIVTNDGKRLGTLGTIYLNTETKRVTHFDVSGGRWHDITEGMMSLPVVEGIVDGRDTVIVPSEVASRRPSAEGGLKAQVASLKRIAQKQVRQASESLERSTTEMKRTAREAGEKAKQAAGKVQAEFESRTEKRREAEQAEEQRDEEPPTEEPEEQPEREEPGEAEPEGSEEQTASEPAETEDNACDEEQQ